MNTRNLGMGSPTVSSGRSQTAPAGAANEDPTVRPVIFVPGTMASAIEVKDSKGSVQPIWPPTGFGGDVKACFEALQSIDPAKMDTYDTSPNGLLPGIHGGLLGFLEGHGYQLRQKGSHRPNLYVHSYNWLQSCADAGAQLAELIKTATTDHGTPPSIIAHSMGGLVTRAALILNGAKVDKVFYVASPHLGTPTAYYATHPEIPYKFASALNQLTRTGLEIGVQAVGGEDAFDNHMKQIAQNARGVLELIPDELYFKRINPTSPVVTHKKRWAQRGGLYERRDFTPDTAADAYKMDNDKDIAGYPSRLAGRISEALAFKASISKPLPPGGEDRTFVIYGAKNDTVCEAEIIDDGPADKRGTVTANLGGDQKGDGTVPTQSGRGGPLSENGVTIERDNTAEHFMMTETPRLHGILAQYLPRGGR